MSVHDETLHQADLTVNEDTSPRHPSTQLQLTFHWFDETIHSTSIQRGRVMISRRNLILGSMIAPAVAAHAEAQGDRTPWSSTPVRIVVGFPPGQGSDSVARILADDLQKRTGTPFIVDNRPGAGGLVAAGVAAKATPDGKTLLFTSSGPFTISPHLYPRQDFDSIKDLDGIALLGKSPTLMIANLDFPANTVADVVKMSKKKELDCGTSGYGITDHLTLEMLKLRSGGRFNHVPYKGSIASLSDLAGGQIQLVFSASTSAASFLQSGKMKIIAVASSERWTARPDVPAISETYPGFDATSWALMAVPRGTPDALKDRIAAHINASMASPTVLNALDKLGLEATPGSSRSATSTYAIAEYEKWGEVVRKAHIRIE